MSLPTETSKPEARAVNGTKSAPTCYGIDALCTAEEDLPACKCRGQHSQPQFPQAGRNTARYGYPDALNGFGLPVLLLSCTISQERHVQPQFCWADISRPFPFTLVCGGLAQQFVQLVFSDGPP